MRARAEVTIVGAGIIGLLTAGACAARGAHVSVLDQGPIPNPDATSYDQHRVLRALHPQDPVATGDAVVAWRRWQELERRLGRSLVHRTGVLTGLNSGEVEPAQTSLAGAGATSRLWTAAAVQRRWPHLRLATPWAIMEPDAGVVLAGQALRTLAHHLARHPSVDLHPRQQVLAVDHERGEVHATGGTWRTSRILIAAGVRTAGLVAAAVPPVRLYRQSMVYCHVPQRLRDAFRGTPVVLRMAPDTGAWLVPPVAGTDLKLSAATACRAVNRVTDHATSPAWRTRLAAAFWPRLVGFSHDWVVSARDCYYAASAGGGGARIATLAPGVLAHLACGGGSFKFAPLVADALATDLLATTPASGGPGHE